jgi:hypothetical protein
VNQRERKYLEASNFWKDCKEAALNSLPIAPVYPSNLFRFPDRTVLSHAQFWPRLETSRSFVLSKLRRILNVGQFRLEMRRRAGFRPGKS